MYQIECLLCNKVWSSNNLEAVLEEFHEHLNKHSKEEVEVLRKLAELDLKNHSAYLELKETLTEFDHEVWRKCDLGSPFPRTVKTDET
jgi:iron-sulfur cluster repair protein YtfE (RIC family)